MLQRVKAPSVGSLGESDRSRVSCQAGVGTEHQKEMSCYYAEPLRFHGCYPSSSPSSLIYLPRQEKIESRSKTWLVPIRTVRPMLWCCVQLGSPHELQAVWACTDQEAYSGKRGCLHLEPSSHLFSRIRQHDPGYPAGLGSTYRSLLPTELFARDTDIALSLIPGIFSLCLC
ncbi:uncharacterized protein LOC105261378 isoform X3 [Felis catus]|uniref:uncharacterized protein LOC105261378 isoform X3 n=1 Tax=Felis catus TaxID=9685 RepID=UPI0009483D19|nr:uncharacterized protein LOC105261378 isoform X3 [Felis catus]